MGEMVYLAHINSEKKEQTLKMHLENTAKLCGKFAESFGMYDWGYCCGLLHDIGKYSSEFQERIRGSEQRVDHATAGAKVCWEKNGLYRFLSYCIAGHHAGLPDTGGSSDVGSQGTMYGRMTKKTKNYQAYKEEIAVPSLAPPPFQVSEKENKGILFSMMIRMLYSCLVDADYLDTESFMQNGKVVRDSGESIEALCGKLEKYVAKWMKNVDLESINGRRTEILKGCIEKGKENKGIFRLTVPTGGGKTIASLAFALEHAKKYGMDRVIYVIPYTSIIEQNARIFRDILGKENVLEDHCNMDYDSDEELKPMHLAAENWDKPVVVTTNVQFFESVFASKASKCRKLHNMANSVIIFDEVQMLPNDYLKPCIAIMEQLVRHYGSSIVLCTATQPALKGILSEDIFVKELCSRMDEQFRFFKRVSIQNIGKIEEDELVKKLEADHQVLCILNTKKRAQKIYKKIKKEGVYHLSTSMYPTHRKRVMCEIRERLKDGKGCIVISTSLVEAGVDLDFEKVYRQLSGVDSIIQAAGRCNREGKRAAEESITYVFQFNEKEYIPGQRLQMEMTECLLSEKRNLEELDTIRYFFEMLYHFREESLDRKNILKRFKVDDLPFATVSKEVKLIEENTKTIFVPKEEKAIEILNELKIKGITKKNMREMGQYCVSVYENDFDKMVDVRSLSSISEKLNALKEEYFVLNDLEKYTEEMGLALDAERGQAVFF